MPTTAAAAVNGGQHLRIGVVAEHQQGRPTPLSGGHLTFHAVDRRQRIAMTAALADDVGQGLQRALGAAVAIQKLAEGNRADPLAAREAQAGETLGFRQAHVLAAPMRGSAPFNRRAMFSWCRT